MESNSCFRCGDETFVISPGVFYCGLCQVEFTEKQGEYPELLPCSFEEGVSYLYNTWTRQVRNSLTIRVSRVFGCFAEIIINDLLRETVAIVPDGDSEFLRFPLGWPYAGCDIYPYRIVT